MKVSKHIWAFLMIAVSLYSCHYDLDDMTEGVVILDPINDTPSIPIENKWWILTHKNYDSPGIYLYNETTETIELKLDLPKNMESPHALAYDGQSLWIGGMGENESIYQINPENGTILSEIKNIKTEGIALSGEFLYYSDYKTIKKLNKQGLLIEEISTKNSSYNIPDIAINDNNLYYLRYSDVDPVIKIDLSNRKESKISLTEPTGTYCLTITNDEIITVNPANEISRFNTGTGVFISTQPTNIKGWITAIAPYDKI